MSGSPPKKDTPYVLFVPVPWHIARAHLLYMIHLCFPDLLWPLFRWFPFHVNWGGGGLFAHGHRRRGLFYCFQPNGQPCQVFPSPPSQTHKTECSLGPQRYVLIGVTRGSDVAATVLVQNHSRNKGMEGNFFDLR